VEKIMTDNDNFDIPVSKSDVIKGLFRDVDEEKNCKSIPMSVFMILAYFVWFSNSQDVSIAYQLQDAYADAIEINVGFSDGHFGLYDIITETDFWDWMEQGVLPFFFRREEYDGTKLEATMWDRMLVWNKMIGPIRLMQYRDDSDNCGGREREIKLQAFYGRKCASGGDSTTIFGVGDKRGTNGFVPGWPQPGTETLATIQEQIDLGQVPYSFEVWLDPMEPPANHLQTVRDLKVGRWFDMATSLIELRLVLYSPNIGTGRFSSLIIQFKTGSGGIQHAKILYDSISADPYLNVPEVLFFDVLLVGLLSNVLIGELRTVRPFWKTGTMWEYWSFWNVITWATLSLGGATFAVWLNIVWSMGDIRTILLRMQERENEVVYEQFGVTHADLAGHNGTGSDYDGTGFVRMSDTDMYNGYGEVFSLFDTALAYMGYMRYLQMFYCYLLMLRCFKAFRAQPKLAYVSNTMGESVADLSHFMMILMSVFIAYGLAGNLLFGSSLKKFFDLQNSVAELFELMMGDFDFEELFKVNPFGAIFWFLSFNILVVLVLLNMFLAIIMDAYTGVKESSDASMNIVVQSLTMLRRFKENREGTRVDLDVIYFHVRSDEFEWEEVTHSFLD
jgi:hypothetical protein